MSDEKLTPERAVRLLRAKAGELENWVLHNANNVTPAPETIWRLTADIALVAQLLADHIEATASPMYKLDVETGAVTKEGYPPPSWPVENQP